jgi:hypothetical protein
MYWEPLLSHHHKIARVSCKCSGHLECTQRPADQRYEAHAWAWDHWGVCSYAVSVCNLDWTTESQAVTCPMQNGQYPSSSLQAFWWVLCACCSGTQEPLPWLCSRPAAASWPYRPLESVCLVAFPFLDWSQLGFSAIPWVYL